jgi:uncharacterized protein
MTDQPGSEDNYICVGICMADPDSGYCLGCGRPPIESPQIVAEVVRAVVATRIPGDTPDQPE